MKLRKSNSFMRRGSGDSQVASSTLRAGMSPLEQPPAKGKKKKAWFDGLNARAAAKVATALVRMEQGNLSNAKGVGAGVSA